MLVDVREVKRHIKPKADSTLFNMKKSDLIAYIRCLESNYNTAVSFNENQARYIESLHIPGKAVWKHRAEHNDFTFAECSNCGFRVENFRCVHIGRGSRDYTGVKWCYCPKCGSVMEV